MTRRYANYLLAIVVTGLTAAALINWLVNPYNLFSSVDIEGFNTIKTEADKLQRLSKAYEIKRARPDAVIIGTSRALYLDSAHPALKGFNSYNLALTSASSYEMLRYLQHAHANNPLKEIVYGIDFISFNETRQPNFSEDRLNAGPDGRYRSQGISSYVGDLLPNLLSLDALGASVKTVKRQGEKSPNSYSATNNKAERVKSRGGHRKMFLREEQNTLADGAADYPDCPDSRPGVKSAPPVYDHFRAILRLAYTNNIRIHMFISPTHARYNEVVCARGLWTTFEDWKRNIVRINEEEARRAKKDISRIWDFSGYTKITTEEVPPLDDVTSLMRWYWEGTHYSRELGDRLLNRVFDNAKGSDDLPDDFGRPLTTDNVEGHLAIIRQSRKRYVETHPGEIDEIGKLVESSLIRQSDAPRLQGGASE